MLLFACEFGFRCCCCCICCCSLWGDLLARLDDALLIVNFYFIAFIHYLCIYHSVITTTTSNSSSSTLIFGVLCVHCTLSVCHSTAFVCFCRFLLPLLSFFSVLATFHCACWSRLRPAAAAATVAVPLTLDYICQLNLQLWFECLTQSYRCFLSRDICTTLPYFSPTTTITTTDCHVDPRCWLHFSQWRIATACDRLFKFFTLNRSIE